MDGNQIFSDLKIPEFEYQGIKRIEIPKTDSDFSSLSGDYGFSTIKKYLPSIISTHQENARKIEFLYNYFLGKQDIRLKERRYKIDAYNNNRITENHAYRQVEFKVGFLTGEQRDYTHKAGSSSDDLLYLDRYFTDCNFYAKDKQLKRWIYATGIGTTYTKPKLDIIVYDGIDKLTGNKKVRFATKEDGFDIDFNAPFNYSVIDPKKNFVVYSSGFDKEPLFCVSIVDIDISNENDISPKQAKQVLIETRYATFIIESDANLGTYIRDTSKIKTNIKTLAYLPMVEFSTNDDRMGIIELNRELFNSINTFRSAIADMVVDSANAILVFKNVDIEADQVQAMKQAGAIIINDAQNSKNGGEADLKTIRVEIPFDGLNSYIDQLLTNCYDIAGVPLASGQVTSGGDTGQARLLGGGWNNAYIMINNDITTLKGYDYEQLKLILLLCKQVPNCQLDKLYASQIDINYHINQSDNYLVKTQGMLNMYSMNFPKKYILKSNGMFDDIDTIAGEWEELDTKAKEIAKTSEEEIIAEKQDNKDDNNSQE
ncbi:MAG: phage portal protein [Christensenellales bacterium]